MTREERNILQERLSLLQNAVLRDFNENTTIGTIIRNYKARIDNFDKTNRP